MDDKDSLRLALNAEKYNHKRDNEYLLAENAALKARVEELEAAMPMNYEEVTARAASAERAAIVADLRRPLAFVLMVKDAPVPAVADVCQALAHRYESLAHHHAEGSDE